jgi:hypothetical protein
LLVTNSTMSGWSAFRMTILAARPRLAAALDHAGERVVAAHERDRSGAVPPPARGSFDERMPDRFEPVPEPNLKSMPSVLARPRIESIVSLTALMKHADACGCFSIPTLNQTGLLNAAFWWHEQVRQLVREVAQVLGGREVALLLGPGADRVRDAPDQLADARLALRRAQLAAEVLRGDDVRRRLAPGRRDLDAVLLEHRPALLVVDDRGPRLPRHLVVRMSPLFREISPEREARPLLYGRSGGRARLAAGIFRGVRGHGCASKGGEVAGG